MSGFLCDTNQDPTLFTKRFDGLIHYLEDQGNWEAARRELTARKVRHEAGRGRRSSLSGR